MNEDARGSFHETQGTFQPDVESVEQERPIHERIDALMDLMHRALQRNEHSALAVYLSAAMADLSLAQHRAHSGVDLLTLEPTVATVMEKLRDIPRAIADYSAMIAALTDKDGKATRPATAVFYHHQILALEEMQADLAALNATL